MLSAMRKNAKSRLSVLQCALRCVLLSVLLCVLLSSCLSSCVSSCLSSCLFFCLTLSMPVSVHICLSLSVAECLCPSLWFSGLCQSQFIFGCFCLFISPSVSIYLWVSFVNLCLFLSVSACLCICLPACVLERRVSSSLLLCASVSVCVGCSCLSKPA